MQPPLIRMFQHLTYEQLLGALPHPMLQVDNRPQILRQQLSHPANQDLDGRLSQLVYQSQLKTHHHRQPLNHQSELQLTLLHL